MIREKFKCCKIYNNDNYDTILKDESDKGGKLNAKSYLNAQVKIRKEQEQKFLKKEDTPGELVSKYNILQNQSKLEESSILLLIYMNIYQKTAT